MPTHAEGPLNFVYDVAFPVLLGVSASGVLVLLVLLLCFRLRDAVGRSDGFRRITLRGLVVAMAVTIVIEDTTIRYSHGL